MEVYRFYTDIWHAAAIINSATAGRLLRWRNNHNRQEMSPNFDLPVKYLQPVYQIVNIVMYENYKGVYYQSWGCR